MQKQPSNFSAPLNSPLYTSESGNSRNPNKIQTFQEQNQTGKNLKIADDFDKIFASNCENISRKSQVLSKVERKDTRETEPEPFDFYMRIQ
jgi:hypothetical protein